MPATDLILAVLVLIMSIALLYVYWSWQKTRNKDHDTHIENVLLEIELKKREIRDEVFGTSVDDLVKRRNDEGN